MINRHKNSHTGPKRKKPTSALTALMYMHGITGYYLQKCGYVNSGYIHNASRRNVKRYTVIFLMQLGKAMHMKWWVVGRKLLDLQKLYPPKTNSHHVQNVYKNKKKKSKSKSK